MWTLIWMYRVRAVPEDERHLRFVCIIPPQSQHCSFPAVGYFTEGGDSGTLSCSLPSWLPAQQVHCRTFTGNGEGLSGLDHLRSVRISRNEVQNYSVGTWLWLCVLSVPTYLLRSWSVALYYRKRGGWSHCSTLWLLYSAQGFSWNLPSLPLWLSICKRSIWPSPAAELRLCQTYAYSLTLS